MKTLLRNPGVQAFLGWLLWLHLIVTLKSRRWTHDNLACVEPVLETGKPAVALFWHGSIPLCLGLAPVWWRREKVRCMVSPSADGEFIAQALSRAGFPAPIGPWPASGPPTAPNAASWPPRSYSPRRPACPSGSQRSPRIRTGSRVSVAPILVNATVPEAPR